MVRMVAVFGVIGAIAGGLGVASGAFGAHALKATLGPERLQVFETASRYQIFHALALLGVALALERGRSGALVASGWMFVVGPALFSGSLYALALSGVRAWGAVTPIGGLCTLAAWGALALGFARRG